ncbi:hypothetical protein ACWT_3309 [Actinoplanes sp. SE50]|nr:hypothetical protein ACPL_3437 [Actinoplanes sp. SE50/110]ATO82724.1 hypothetical protein ACWT_3309 [Actinoplanes sp. SE50]SLM00131.1 hypothetical protein ACSP50_3363 [Actinoplanes sp. SE50/110]
MQLNHIVRGAASIALGVSVALALTAPAWAGRSKDPAGANGTVKIDAVPFDPKISNNPHVTCEFRVKFFNFDTNEHGNIVFTAQPPSGKGTELLRQNNVLLSDDAAKGGAPDPDEIYTYSAGDLKLDGLKLQPKQGYHIKLTVERIGAPGAGKHKVFWLQPCASQNGGGSSSTPASAPSSSSSNPVPAGNESALPITGSAASTVAAVGLVLIGSGAALTIRRRRKFTA